MSTIVVPDYSYRRKGLGEAIVNFVGPIIGDWIKSEREKEVNRKNNVAIYEAAKSLGLAGNDYANLPPSMNNNNGGLLGGSNNGWENAFRNMSDNPLTQFDTNTADIAPNANVSHTLNQPQQRIPTPAEFMQAMANVVGSDTKRFGLVNLKNLQELTAPIMAAYENSRNEQRRKEIGETLKNSANSPERLANIWNAVAQGILPIEAVTHARAETQPYNIDTGSAINRGIFDYASGKYVDQDKLNKSLSPQDVANNQFRDRQLDETIRTNDRTYDLENRKQTFLEEQARIARENPELKPQYGEDGTLYYVNPYTGQAVYSQTPDGNFIKVDPNSYSKNKTNSSTNWTAQDRARIQAYDKEIQHLENRIKDIAKQRDNDIQNEETKKKYNDQIADLEKQIQDKIKEKNEYINNRRGINTNQNANQNSSARYIYQNGQTAYTDYDIALAEEKIRNGGTIPDENGNPIDTVDKLHAWLRSQGLIDLRDQNQNQNQNSTNPRNQNQSTSTQISGNNNSQNSTSPQNIQSAPSGSTNNTDDTEFEPVEVDMANQGIAFRNPSNGKTITKERFYNHVKRAKGEGINIYEKSHEGAATNRRTIRTEEELVDYYKSQGYRDIRLANSPNKNNTSVAQSKSNQGTGLSPFPTAEEKERAATQGSTGSDIARVPEKQGEAVLNGNNPPSNNYNGDEYNSEVMWSHPDGRSITKSEYNKNNSDYNDRLRIAGVENPDYDAWLEAEGYRRADNSNSPAPVGTDYINGTTPQDTKRQLAYLNGNEVRNGTNFMGEELPELMQNGAMTASLTPMGLSGSRNNFRSLSDSNNRNPLNPFFDFLSESPAINQAVSDKYPNENYNPYDINADTGQPYDDNDVYEQGFKFDNEQNNGITIPDELNGGYKNLPLIKIPNTKEQGNLNHAMPIPNGDINEDVFSNMTLLAAPRNGRRRSGKGRAKVNTPVQTRQNTRIYTQNDYPDVRIPKREARRPGRIKTNTSYQNLKPIVDDAAKRHGLNHELIRAIIQVESQWDSNALSNAGAKGLMQLMPGTAREVGVRDAYDVAQNINGGSKYIARMIKMFNGNVANALMAYNWGPGNMRKALKGKKSIPAGVKKYARDILSIYNNIKSRRGR